MPSKVLNKDWSDYNDMKGRGRHDVNNFDCSEAWEVDYLVEKIKQSYPVYKEVAIKRAIVYCCNKLGSSTPRENFITGVLRRLNGYPICNRFLENHS